jgi:hypothetical protein
MPQEKDPKKDTPHQSPPPSDTPHVRDTGGNEKKKTPKVP